MKQTIKPQIARCAAAGLLLTISLPITQLHADDIYKWVDEDNQIQYTQMPPPHGIKSIRIQRTAPVGDEDDSGEQDVTEEAVAGDQDAGDSDLEQDSDGTSGDNDAEIAKANEENCNIARKNLQTLNRGQVRFFTPEGEVIRLTEEERQQRIQESRELIKLLCKS